VAQQLMCAGAEARCAPIPAHPDPRWRRGRGGFRGSRSVRAQSSETASGAIYIGMSGDARLSILMVPLGSSTRLQQIPGPADTMSKAEFPRQITAFGRCSTAFGESVVIPAQRLTLRQGLKLKCRRRHLTYRDAASHLPALCASTHCADQIFRTDRRSHLLSARAFPEIPSPATR
jgi:hypothetical protein